MCNAVVAGSAEGDPHHLLDDVLTRQLHHPLGVQWPQLCQLVVQPVSEALVVLAHWAGKVCLELLEFAGELKMAASALVHHMVNVLEQMV
jgi:hypothetical protein